MKNKILNYFIKDRSYRSGVALINEFSTKGHLKWQLIALPESDFMTGVIYDELRELAGLTYDQFSMMVLRPVVKSGLLSQDKSHQKDLESVMETDKGPATTEDICVKDIPVTFVDLNSMPVFRLRLEFPFLNSPSCPNELKILVADMITAHDAYKKHHASLFLAHTIEEIFHHSKATVEKYLENRSIWDELDYYKDHGVVLGKHPIFRFMNRIKQIREMNTGSLLLLRDHLLWNIKYQKRKLKKEPGNTMTKERSQKMQDYQKELIEVKRLLNL